MRIVAILALLACTTAYGTESNSNTLELLNDAGEAVLLALVDSKISGSCLVQITTNNREYIANKTECLTLLTEIKEGADDTELGIKVKDKIEEFKSRYWLAQN